MTWTPNVEAPWLMGRRGFVGTAIGASVLAPMTAWSAQQDTGGGALTKEARDRPGRGHRRDEEGE
jgi:hypothetical protein